MKLNIKKFAGDTWGLTTSFSDYKYNANGELIQVTLTITSTYNVSSIYDIDNKDNEISNYSSWENHYSSDSYPHTDMPYIRRTFYNLNNLKGVKLVTYESPNTQTKTITYNFKMGTEEEQKTTYLTKTNATAVLKGNVLNSLNTYDYNNAPSVAAVRNYLESGSLVHQSDVDDIISQAVSNALLAAHPVGSIEINITGTNPSEYLGGTWEQITSDAYLKIVTQNAGELGGTSSDHKIPISSMPSHNHQTTFRGGNSGDGGNAPYAAGKVVGQNAAFNSYPDYWMGKAGGGQAYYPYYYGVYIWKRIN